MGDGSLGSVCLFTSLISAMSTLLLWPVFIGLSLAGLETITWTELPWLELCAAAGLTLSTETRQYISYDDICYVCMLGKISVYSWIK